MERSDQLPDKSLNKLGEDSPPRVLHFVDGIDLAEK